MSWIDDVRAAAADPSTAGVLGSLLSLKWVPGSEWLTKIFSFGCGIGCAIYGAPVLISALDIKWANAQSLFAFLLGFLGMNVLVKTWEWIKSTSVSEIISTWRGGSRS